MIGEFFLNIIFGFVSGFFGLLPDISWNPGGAAISFISDCVASVVYLLPMGAITGIIYAIVAMQLFKIVISFIKTLWDLLPIV